MAQPRTGRMVAFACLAATSCRDVPPPSRAHTLADDLGALATLDADHRTQAIESWKLDRATWDRTVVEPYHALFEDYARDFDAAVPALSASLARRATITTHAHYAGDPRLTVGQARTRWALPVQFPSEVVELDGAPLDLVFVRSGAQWKAIRGIDTAIRARVDKLDPACAAHLDGVRTGRCGDVGWVIADAALRTDPTRFAHACTLASTLCAR